MAQRSLAYRLGVPLQYVKKCPPDLQALNLNHRLAKERNEELFLRFDGDDLRAVFTPRYVPVDNLTVLKKLEMMSYPMDAEVQCHLDRDFMSLSILDAAGEFAVQGSDRMRPGISIGNSEVGLSVLSISAFILRLVCTKGLISKTEVEASYRHVSTRILNDFPTTIGDVSARMVVDKKRFGFSLASEVKLRTLPRPCGHSTGSFYSASPRSKLWNGPGRMSRAAPCSTSTRIRKRPSILACRRKAPLGSSVWVAWF